MQILGLGIINLVAHDDKKKNFHYGEQADIRVLYFWLFASLAQKFISGSVGMLIREMECLVTGDAKIYFLFSSDKFINYSIEEGGKNTLPSFFFFLL